MKISEIISTGRTRIHEAGLECADPLLHMKQIAEAALDTDATGLYLRWESELSVDEIRRIEAILTRRLAGEPFQYIVGYEWFWKSKFQVGPGALIPRRETEVLLEVLLQEAGEAPIRCAELGPGTGIIGISALLERPRWEWLAFELNLQSLPYLNANNRTLLPPAAPFSVVPGDFFLLAGEKGPYDWVVSNPPYVATAELPKLSREVRHEPPLALDGGAEGLDVIGRLALDAKRLLKPAGRILLEIGSEQESAVSTLFWSEGYNSVRVIRDYAKLPRVLLAQWDG
jgi:release factor glutamine methyltransferase